MATRKLSEETTTGTVFDDDIVLLTQDPLGLPVSRTVPLIDLRAYMQLGILPTGVGTVVLLSANTILNSSHSGATIFVDTDVLAADITLTVADDVVEGWEVSIIREGAFAVDIIGEATMSLVGPAAESGTVTIAVEYGGVSLVRRSTTETWAAGVVTPEGFGRVVLLASDTTLTDAHTGATIFVDTTTPAAPVTLTIADDVSEGWECVVIREGADNVVIEGEATMALGGPASSGGTVTIAVDDGGVSLLRRSTTKTWAAGVIA